MSQEKEYFAGLNIVDADHERCYWRRLGVIVFLAGLLLYGVIGAIRNVNAAPLVSASAEGAIITLTDEPCALKAISNLPFRATWVEKDKSYEGCYGVRADVGLVVAYFNDATVALIPMQVFKKVVGA